MKRTLLTLVALLTVASIVLLAGCAPKPTEAPAAAPTEAPAAAPTEAPPPTAAPAAAEPVKIVIFVGFGTGTSPEQIAVHDQLAEEFNTTHEDIQIEFLTVPWEERITKFSTMLAGDMTPDIAMPIGVGGIAEFYDEWMDLTPFIERDNYDMSDFFGKTVEIHTYPEKGILGLPLCVYPSVVYYNQDLFDAAGVEYPPHEWEAAYADGDPWNLDKLVEISKKLTLDADGNNADSPAFNWENSTQWGWNGWDWSSLGSFVQKFGGRPTGISEDGKTALLNSEGWVQTMSWVKDTVWTWHIRASSEQAGAFYDAAGDPMGSGMVAMWECHSWMSYAWPSWTESFNWDVAAVPAAGSNKPQAPVDADTFVMPKSGKHPDEAWEVVKWFFQPENMERLVKNYGCMPARGSSIEKWFADRQAEYPNVDFQVFADSLNYVDIPNHESYTPEYTKKEDAIQTALDLVLTGENLDVQAVMDTLNTTVQGYLDEYWATHQ